MLIIEDTSVCLHWQIDSDFLGRTPAEKLNCFAFFGSIF